MDTTTTWWEPPVAGDEYAQLTGALERLRATFRWKTDGLDAAGLDHRLATSTLSLGGLLKHLAAQEDYLFHVKLLGRAMPEVWSDHGWDGDNDWEFRSAAADPPDRLYDLYDGAVTRSRAILAAAYDDGGLGRATATSVHGQAANLRRLVLDLIEEYGRHTGQADLLREAVDGRVGEDPEEGWVW